MQTNNKKCHRYGVHDKIIITNYLKLSKNKEHCVHEKHCTNYRRNVKCQALACIQLINKYFFVNLIVSMGSRTNAVVTNVKLDKRRSV